MNTYRTVGTYEYYNAGMYLEAKLQVRFCGLWLTRAKTKRFVKTQNSDDARQLVRFMRKDIADAHGLVSNLSPVA